jgi:hypothetical protein
MTSPSFDMTPKTRALAGNFILGTTGTSSGPWESHLLFLRFTDTSTVKIFASEKIWVKFFFIRRKFSQSCGALGNPLLSQIFYQHLLDFQGVRLVPEIFCGNMTHYSQTNLQF